MHMHEIDPQFVNNVIHGDCVEGMARLPSECIPLTVTSPPYDHLRHYGGQVFDLDKFRDVADQLFRITMPGGVVVWVVQNQIVDGGESAEGFRQCLHFRELGFRLHNTIIMARNGRRSPSTVRYVPSPEYAFVLSKGRPRAINLIQDRPNSTAGERLKQSIRFPDGSLVTRTYETKFTPDLGQRGTVWVYDAGYHKTTKDQFAFEHPALMPEAMARDLIWSWSRPGDLVFDPMCGAGTTCKMAVLLGRHFLGLEIVARYCDIARERVRQAEEDKRGQPGQANAP
jgi:site-specific DNA-methyltransferase (adenine-specific)